VVAVTPRFSDQRDCAVVRGIRHHATQIREERALVLEQTDLVPSCNVSLEGVEIVRDGLGSPVLW